MQSSSWSGLFITNVPIRVQLDTASNITLISGKTWKLLGYPSILPTENMVRNGFGSILEPVEMIEYIVQFRDYFLMKLVIWQVDTI